VFKVVRKDRWPQEKTEEGGKEENHRESTKGKKHGRSHP